MTRKESFYMSHFIFDTAQLILLIEKLFTLINFFFKFHVLETT